MATPFYFCGHPSRAGNRYDSIFVDSKKVETIVNWEQPKNVIDIRSFLGLVRYYRRFVEYFSLLFASLTRWTQKGVKFEWDEKYEQSFQELKNRLITAQF